MNDQQEVDLLHRIETLTRQINNQMADAHRSALRRYPLSFTLLALFGVVAVSEGIKGGLEVIGFDGHPWYLLLAGLVILVVTGTLYKKLEK